MSLSGIIQSAQRHASEKDLATRALELGKAAEHIVCADLILAGHDRTFLSDQGLPYDLLVEVDGRFIRVQVKSTMRAKNWNTQGKAPNFVYNFSVRRRGKHGKGERLTIGHCDIVALVALDIRVVAYFPISEVATTMALYPIGYTFPGKFKRNRRATIDGFPFDSALAKLGAIR